MPPPAFPAWDDQRALSADFIGYLNFLVGLESENHPSEAALYERFAGIGSSRCTAWQPENAPADVLDAIQAGVTKGLAEIDHQVSRTTSSIGLFGSREQLADDYLTRAVAANMGIYGQVAQEAIYGGSRLDANGDQLLGGQRYELRFDQASLPDAKFFWSITLYELPQPTARRQPDRPVSIRDRTARITYAQDGSLTIVVRTPSHHRPRPARQPAAYLPPKDLFTVIYRIYGPGQDAQTDSRPLPPIQTAP